MVTTATPLNAAPTTDNTYDSTPKVGENALSRARALRTRFLVALPLGTIVMVL